MFLFYFCLYVSTYTVNKDVYYSTLSLWRTAWLSLAIMKHFCVNAVVWLSWWCVGWLSGCEEGHRPMCMLQLSIYVIQWTLSHATIISMTCWCSNANITERSTNLFTANWCNLIDFYTDRSSINSSNHNHNHTHIFIAPSRWGFRGTSSITQLYCTTNVV